jgi:hypothetical protein
MSLLKLRQIATLQKKIPIEIKRQEWNEHIFGTIKRKMGLEPTNLKGLKKVNEEFAGS